MQTKQTTEWQHQDDQLAVTDLMTPAWNLALWGSSSGSLWYRPGLLKHTQILCQSLKHRYSVSHSNIHRYNVSHWNRYSVSHSNTHRYSAWSLEHTQILCQSLKHRYSVSHLNTHRYSAQLLKHIHTQILHQSLKHTQCMVTGTHTDTASVTETQILCTCNETHIDTKHSHWNTHRYSALSLKHTQHMVTGTHTAHGHWNAHSA